MKLPRKKKINIEKECRRKLNKQLKVINKATDMALEQVERERRDKNRNYIVEWFRYIELAGKELHKHLN